MPKDFEACVRHGGKTRTVSIDKRKYMHVCKKRNGKWTRGHVHRRKGR